MAKLRVMMTVCLVAVVCCAMAARAEAQASKTASPELVGLLSKELGSTPKQAEGAAGSLFQIAKSQLKPEDFAQVAKAVPGMAGLLKAAPALSGGNALSQVAGTSGVAGLSALAGAASAFSKLGLSPELVSKAIPVITQFVTKSGGAGVGNLLAGVLK
ncbi:MAG TPA: DUF2780 domain-containing protein [Vicinamibacterales bacterium]|jgi:hypothetical protein